MREREKESHRKMKEEDQREGRIVDIMSVSPGLWNEKERERERTRDSDNDMIHNNNTLFERRRIKSRNEAEVQNRNE